MSLKNSPSLSERSLSAFQLPFLWFPRVFVLTMIFFLCNIFFSVSEEVDEKKKPFFSSSSFFLSRFFPVCALPRCPLLCSEAGWPHREETPLQRRQLFPRRQEQQQRCLRRLVRIPDRSPQQQQQHRPRDRNSLPLLLRSASARLSHAWDRASILRASRSLARSCW